MSWKKSVQNMLLFNSMDYFFFIRSKLPYLSNVSSLRKGLHLQALFISVKLPFANHEIALYHSICSFLVVKKLLLLY